MLKKLLFFSFMICGSTMVAQIEIPRSSGSGTVIKAEESNKSGFPILKREETKTESRFLKDKPKGIDLRENPNNLLTSGDLVEKQWTEDRKAKESYGKDQNLGNVITTGKFVEIYCRDHEYVDGDVVQIFVNGQLAEKAVRLKASFHPVLVGLQDGFNTIEFVALNQGTSGPNTAELRVLNDKGEQLAVKEWNLLTGAKAQLIVVKN